VDPADVSDEQLQRRGPRRQIVIVHIAEVELHSGSPVVSIPLEAPFNEQLDEYRGWTAVSHTFTLKPGGGAVLTILFERSVP
jgi:hypothetical protein